MKYRYSVSLKAFQKSQEDFGTLVDSFLSFFAVLVFDDTFALVRRTKTESGIYASLLLVFIFIGAFTVFDVVVCDDVVFCFGRRFV